MADNTSTAPAVSAPTTTAPAVDNTIQTWTVNGKPVQVHTGEIRGGADKGKPLFRFLPSGQPKVPATLSQVVSLLATLDVGDQVAPLIDREILHDLAREVSAKIRVVDGNGVYRLNDGILAKSIKEVIAAYLEQKAGKDALRTELAALSVRQSDLMQRITAVIAAGKDLRSAEYNPLTNEATQVAVKISDLNNKLKAAAVKAAKKTAAAAAPAPTLPAAPAVAK